MTDFFKSSAFDYHIERVSYEYARILGMNEYNRSNRKYHQLVYKLDGSSRQFIDEFRFDLIPGSVLFIPSTVKEHKADVYALGSTINVTFRIYGDEEYLFKPSIINIGDTDRFFRLEAAHHLGRGFRCQAIFSGLLDRLSAHSEREYIDGGKYALIAPAISYIEQNCFTEQITVGRLCELCGISGEYLRRLFRSFTGKSPVEYINTLKLENARTLLQSGNFSVTEAALSSGFDNSSYFSRLFTRKYGYPPNRVLFGLSEHGGVL